MVRCSRCGWDNPQGIRRCEKCNAPLMFDVFISYSRKDYVDDAGNVLPNNMLSKIRDSFKANGISYWFDEEGIYSGDEFASVLTNAIRNSRIFLFISSVNSNQSKWTSNEISTALEFKKPIIPLRLDKSPYNDSVMMKIVSFDYIECKDEEKAMSKLLRAIRHHIPDNKQIDSRLFEIPQSVKGATVIMDIGDKKVEHIMSFESSSLKHKTSDSIINHIHLEEIVDSCDCFRPNDISICVADRKTPIVLLIGPAGVGKTMTLVRLARYLSEIGYSVCPDRTFRSVSDQGYNKLCDSFQDLINGAYAAPGTRLLDCLLVKILKEGRNILQIVDFAGEVFMDFDSNMAPSYLYQLLNLDNPIIWVIMIEPYWADMNSRRGYVEKIRELKRQYISSKDKTIIIVNKIDKTPFLESKSIIDRKGVFNHIRMEYPELMEIFLNVSPFFKFFKPYDCTLVPFMSGRYTSRDDGPLLYIPSSKEFPQTLWNELIKK